MVPVSSETTMTTASVSSERPSAARWRDQVDAKERVLVGMNKYESAEMQDIEVFRVNPESERIAVERVRELRARRDAAIELVGEEACERYERYLAYSFIGFTRGNLDLYRIALKRVG